MAVNGIGYGYYGNSYGINNISALYRKQLQNAARVNRSSAVSRSNVTRYLEKSSSNFLKTYNSSMSSLMTNANNLRAGNAAGVWNKTAVSSSEPSVLDIKQNYRMSSPDTYEVDVKQLATGQTNVSNGMTAKDFAASDAAFSISGPNGSFSVDVKALDASGNAKTNGQMLTEIADVVNKSGIGVKASISTKDGVSEISFASEKTGKDNAFKIEGDFAKENGFDKVSEQAANAEYTVAKNGQAERTYSSAENKVDLDYGRMSATLKTTGKSTVSVGADRDGIVSSTKNLVKQYNDTLNMLHENADRGFGVQRQLDNMLNTPISEKSMNQLGISKDKDGYLKIDEDKLRDSLKTNPQQTKELLGGSFSFAQGLFDDGRQGLSQPGASLIQSDMQTGQQNSFNNMFNLMGMYSRSGAYTMSNFFTLGNYINVLV